MTRTSRISRTGALLGALATAGIVLAAPGAAHAATYIGQFLGPGVSACTSQSAAYRVRLDATATARGAKFRLYRDGAQIAASPTPTTTAWGVEVGSGGTYTACAVNTGTTNTFVTLRLRSDGEF